LAADYFNFSADQDYAPAQYAYYLCLIRGQSVSQDVGHEIYYFGLAYESDPDIASSWCRIRLIKKMTPVLSLSGEPLTENDPLAIPQVTQDRLIFNRTGMIPGFEYDMAAI
jgi:hypothetical protein